MAKIRVMSVFGTRPEAIKMCPLVKVLAQSDEVQSIVCVTGQHRQMLDQVLDIFKVQPDYDLDIMTSHQTLSSITALVVEKMGKVLKDARPDIVLVHGDTTTSFAAALSAFYQQILVGHVEAGLRTYNKYSPFPEEMNRALTGRLAHLHFAPTENNATALLAEKIGGNIYVTGNTVIDAFATTVKPNYRFRCCTLNDLPENKRMVLMTAHRRENIGTPLENICDAVLEICRTHPDLHVVYPVHLNPAVRNTVYAHLSNHPQITLVDPIDVQDMHNLLSQCTLVLTDSGGLQEEAPYFGKPVVVLRTETERPEAVDAGTVVVAGVKKESIVQSGSEILDDEMVYARMSTTRNPYGDGHASEYILQHLVEYFKRT